MTGADPYEMWDAAYVLGSLSSTERREYEAHLAQCSPCRSAVAELSGMPALLAMIGPQDVAAIDEGALEPPPIRAELLDEVLAEVHRRRRRTRWLTWSVSAAAAAVLLVGVILTIAPAQLGGSPKDARVGVVALNMTPAATPSEFDATVVLRSEGWGTHVEMTCTYREESASHDGSGGDKLAMYAIGRDGSRVQLATWMAQQGATASPSGSTSMAIGDIAAVQVVSADTGDVLLQHSL
ncbi:anti-sigma factor [Mycolicibacterium anyangense]|uniref:Anti-sigma factor n=1 Tax=Mycolicibacterium anyangense TaxID=1431246 RepID=A0A6N4WKQ1_9MYCO|nr:zf-HC2 domain-containing protein [Mycolicibacterium anyangense]BBZ79681.1 anti-sigma factor [Mycolicibacterium anyangense]